MPQLLVRGLAIEQMCQISESLVDQLATICQCGTDNFMIEIIHTTSIFGGAVVTSYPFIEVAWFERGQEVRDQFARVLTEHVMSLGIAEVEIAFVTYQEDCYYINGVSCSK